MIFCKTFFQYSQTYFNKSLAKINRFENWLILPLHIARGKKFWPNLKSGLGRHIKQFFFNELAYTKLNIMGLSVLSFSSKRIIQ